MMSDNRETATGSRTMDERATDHPSSGRPGAGDTRTGNEWDPIEAAGASGADEQAGGTRRGLWTGDTGTLREGSRRALLELLKGPYLSGAQRPQLWSALLADETAIRSRLHDLFLELVIDRIDEFAFTRKVRTGELDVPSALRSEGLTFIETAMLLVLRQLLLATTGDRRVIVGRDEVFERLTVYRSGDEATFRRNLNSAWSKMAKRLRVIHAIDDDRAEISPVVKFLIDEDRVRELTALYRSMSRDSDARANPEPRASMPTLQGEADPNRSDDA